MGMKMVLSYKHWWYRLQKHVCILHEGACLLITFTQPQSRQQKVSSLCAELASIDWLLFKMISMSYLSILFTAGSSTAQSFRICCGVSSSCWHNLHAGVKLILNLHKQDWVMMWLILALAPKVCSALGIFLYTDRLMCFSFNLNEFPTFEFNILFFQFHITVLFKAEQWLLVASLVVKLVAIFAIYSFIASVFTWLGIHWNCINICCA
jgi:hypothetical protein